MFDVELIFNIVQKTQTDKEKDRSNDNLGKHSGADRGSLSSAVAQKVADHVANVLWSLTLETFNLTIIIL